MVISDVSDGKFYWLLSENNGEHCNLHMMSIVTVVPTKT